MTDPLISACYEHIADYRSTLWGQFSVADEAEKLTAALWLASQVQSVLVRLKTDDNGVIDLREKTGARD